MDFFDELRLVSYFDTNLFSVYQILRAEMSIQ